MSFIAIYADKDWFSMIRYIKDGKVMFIEEIILEKFNLQNLINVINERFELFEVMLIVDNSLLSKLKRVDNRKVRACKYSFNQDELNKFEDYLYSGLIHFNPGVRMTATIKMELIDPKIEKLSPILKAFIVAISSDFRQPIMPDFGISSIDDNGGMGCYRPL